MRSFFSPRQAGNWLENDENKMLISANIAIMCVKLIQVSEMYLQRRLLI